MAGSLAAGLIAAALLVAAPFIRPGESEIMGAMLCGFAVGWGLMALLSVRFTEQPQPWAAAPALFMGTSGVLLVLFGTPVDEVLSWVWPPALLVLVIWIFFRARKQLRSRSRGWLVYPLLALLALTSIGGAYQTLGAAADARAFPMPGQLVDVGGYRLHLNCTGKGDPTVVLEPGAGEMSSNHALLSQALSSDTRTCVYDRAGRGWSEPADTAQDARQIATDLHTLLHNANIPGPYVMAGHSFGGLYVQAFAANYPDEVAGMVLIDATNRAAAPVTPTGSARGGYNVLSRIATLISTIGRAGAARSYASFEDVDSLPPRARDEVHAAIADPGNLRSTLDEYIQANTSMEEATALRNLSNKPLVVLTAGIGNDSKHDAAQNELANLSTNSVHKTIGSASHEALITNHDAAAITTQAILDVVTSVRTGATLSH
ncbi:alpha/beta fold hydrolase [Arthrobacter sp. KNU-44]|uniref:alpha/beta fold hydrolase n=1 Tax=Arthrobacter sp. KNU-44 TaxID=3450744 RepID=UPI003F42835B